MTGLNLAAADKWSGSPDAKLFPNFGEFIWEFICLNFCDSNVIFWSHSWRPATNQVSKAGRWIWMVHLVPSLKLTANAPENWLSRKETIGFQPSIFRFSMLVSGSVVPFFSKTTAEAALMTGAGVAGATGSFPMWVARTRQVEPSVRDVIQENMHPQTSFFTYLGLRLNVCFHFMTT